MMRSKTQMVIDRILQVREFTSPGLAAELDVKRTDVSNALDWMRKNGYIFTKEQKVRWHPARYRLMVDDNAPLEPEPEPSAPKPTGSYASQIKERLLAGDTLDAQQCMTELGCSHAMLGYTISRMRKRGYRFDEKVIPGTAGALSYTLRSTPPSTPTPTPFTDGLKHELDTFPLPSPAPSPPTTATAALNGFYVPMGTSWLPALGEAVQVTLLALDRDGTVRMALAGEDGSCLLRLESASGG